MEERITREFDSEYGRIVVTEVFGHIVPKAVEYLIVEAQPERWWRAATYYVDSDFGRMGPMPLESAKQALAIVRMV